MTFGRVVVATRRLRRAAVATRLRTRVQRETPSGRAAERPVPDAGLGPAGLDLTGLSVLDVGPPDGTVAAAAARAGAAGTVAAAGLDGADGPVDVIVLRDLHRAADPAGTVWRLRERTRGLAIVVTPATEWPGHERLGLLEIRPGDDTAPVAWSPSADGLRELLLAAGFSDVRVVVGPPAYRRRGWRPVHYGLVVHARP